MKKLFIFLIFSICLILSFSSYTFADYINPKNVVVFKDGSFAYMQVSNINITTQNGAVIARSASKSVPELHETTVKTTTTTPQTEIGNIDIVFVLDTSISMDQKTTNGISRMSVLKTATKKLIEKLYTIYNGNEDHLKIGIIKFSSKYTEKIIYDLNTSDISTLNSKIDSLSASGGTTISNALNMANKMLSEDTETENKHIVIVTDGEVSNGDKEDAKNASKTISKKNINLSTVLISQVNSNVFGSPSNPNPSKNRVFSTKNSQDDIYDKIFNKIGSVIEESITTETTAITDASVYIDSKTTKNISEIDNLYLITLPNDIIYGSAIEVQYDFIINSKYELSNVTIEDYFKNCDYLDSYNALQGSLKNSDYKWSLDANKSQVKTELTDMNSYLEDSTNGYIYKFKLVLKSLLSVQNDTLFENMAKISMTNVKGQSFSANPLTDEHSLASYKISVCPPTGKANIDIKLFVFIIILLYLFVILIRKIKRT